jgi:hypothetical protein
MKLVPDARLVAGIMALAFVCSAVAKETAVYNCIHGGYMGCLITNDDGTSTLDITIREEDCGDDFGVPVYAEADIWEFDGWDKR